MRKVLLFYFLFVVFQTVTAQDRYPRSLNADVLHYEFSVSINDSTDRIEGRALIQIRFTASADSISFDLQGLNNEGNGMVVRNVSVQMNELKWRQETEKLSVTFQNIIKQNDIAEFIIEYGGIPSDGLIISKNKYGNRTFFADHWPNRAHYYLPCIDHPYDKASVDFIITAPDRYKVVASGVIMEESDLPGPFSLTHWSEKVPIATKVMTFGAATFATQYAGSVNNIPVWSWVYPENWKEGFSDYSIALKPLEYYSKIIGPYPYRKLANVQSKTIYGGLENAGTIFYSERSVTGQGKAEGLIAHEIAHQWFGNCVTEADWCDIWLSEGFATYLTSLYFESMLGKERLKADMISARTRVLKFYEKTQSPIVDTTITNLMDLLSPNSYQKGAWVLHMLRFKIGDEDFMKGLRLFYQRFFNSNAFSKDFQNVMEEVSGKSLDKYFSQWLYTQGQPELAIRTEEGRKKGTIVVEIEQKQKSLFEFDIELLIKDLTEEKIVSATVKERKTKIEIQATPAALITPDPNVNLLFR